MQAGLFLCSPDWPQTQSAGSIGVCYHDWLIFTGLWESVSWADFSWVSEKLVSDPFVDMQARVLYTDS